LGGDFDLSGTSGALAFVPDIWMVADALGNAVALGVEMKAHKAFPEIGPREQATQLVEVGIEPTASSFVGWRSTTELLSLRREKYLYQSPLGENMVGEQAGSGSPFGRSLQWKKYPMTLSPPTKTYFGQCCVWSLRCWRDRKWTSLQNPQLNGNLTPVPSAPSLKILIEMTLPSRLIFRFMALNGIKE
jgi:hypothetical protein